MAYQSGPISSFTEKIPSSSDYVPIVDVVDPLVKNKKSTVGNLFKSVPYSSGSSSPAIAFGSSNNSGIYSPGPNQVGIRVGNTSNITFSKSVGSISIGISDNVSSDSDLSFSAYGAGKINFNSLTSFSDKNLLITSNSNPANTVSFDLNNVSGTNTIVIPAGTGGTLVFESGTQNLYNKTLFNPLVSGSLNINQADLIVVNNKVGVGINSPDYRLHVLNDIKISGQTPTIHVSGLYTDYEIVNNNSFSLDFNQVNFGTILSLSPIGTYTPALSTININYNSSLYVVGSGTTTAVFDPFGNVGIGVATPQQKLDVLGAARISDGLYRPNGASKLLEYNNSTTYHYSNQEFKSGTGTTTNLIIKSNGLVGIGKTTPTATLDVSGRVRIDSFSNIATVAQRVIDTSISSNILNLDLDSGSVFNFTLNQNINTINYNFSKGSIDSNSHFTITLIIVHDGSSYSVNWNPNAPTSYKILWVPDGGYGTGISAGITAPSLQSDGPGTNLVPSKDIITLTTYDSGSTFIGRYVAALPAS